MKLLIIGSEGFIGSNAVKYFKTQGYTVTCADIILKDEPNYILINPESPSFTDLFRTQLYDVVINATGAANVQFSFTYPHVDYVLNTANVYAILEAIRLYNPQSTFINLSSAAVYGNPTQLPIKETDAVKPLSPYGYHKHYSEQICKEYHDLFNIKTISLRIFSAYGEGLKKQLFWDLFNKAKAATTHIEMFGTGNETRDFIYVKDLVYAIECVMKNNYFTGGTINIASGTESSIREAVTAFLKAYNPTLEVRFSGNNKKGDPLNWRADISTLESLGFLAQYSLKEGIKETVQWLKEQK